MTAPSDLFAPADSQARTHTKSEHARDPDALDIEPNRPFYGMVWPDDPGAWQPYVIAGEDVPADEVGTWLLPTPQWVRIMPGVAGHRTLAPGEAETAQYDDAVRRLVRRGGIYLDPEQYPYRNTRPAQRLLDGRPHGAKGQYYYLCWDHPELRGRTSAHGYRWVRDTTRYARWLLSLVRTGVVPSPSAEIVATRIREAQAAVARVQAIDGISDDRRRTLLEDPMERLRLETEARVPVEIEPAPRRRRAA